MHKLIKPALITLGLYLLASDGIFACNVPVFRYALERWPASEYPVTLTYSTNPTAEEKALEAALRTTPANISIEVEKTATSQSMFAARFPEDHLQGGPYYTEPASTPEGGPQAAQVPFWKGPLSAAAIHTLVDSPARRDLVRRLLSGEACVWIVLESGKKVDDDRVAALLEKHLPEQSASIELPELGPEDPVMNAPPATEVKFSVLRLSKDAVGEEAFVKMLQGIDPTAPTGETLVFAIFGRARCLPPIPGKEFSPEIITSISTFVCGACSCELKHLNPGKDLLVLADWDGSIGEAVVKDPPLPPLIGLAEFAPPTSESEAPKAIPAANPPTSSHLARNAAIAISVLCVATLMGTFFLRRKS